jgi:hypothetical protein
VCGQSKWSKCHSNFCKGQKSANPSTGRMPSRGPDGQNYLPSKFGFGLVNFGFTFVLPKFGFVKSSFVFRVHIFVLEHAQNSINHTVHPERQVPAISETDVHCSLPSSFSNTPRLLPLKRATGCSPHQLCSRHCCSTTSSTTSSNIRIFAFFY